MLKTGIMMNVEMTPEQTDQIIGTQVCVLRMDERRVCFMTVFPDVRMTLQHLQEIEKALFNLSGNQPFRMLMDVRNRYIQFDTDARNYAATAAITKLFLAEAVILNNLPNRLLFNFFLNFNRPGFPIRAFSQVEPATTWLMAH